MHCIVTNEWFYFKIICVICQYIFIYTDVVDVYSHVCFVNRSYPTKRDVAPQLETITSIILLGINAQHQLKLVVEFFVNKLIYFG